MGGDGQFLEIVLLAMIAGFIFLRLRSVLGRRTGEEKQRDPFWRRREEKPDDKVVRLPDRPRDDAPLGRPTELSSDPLSVGLTQIKISDSSFDAASFAGGARVAYEMIVTSFANGDLDTLRPLVNDEVYRNFASAVQARESRSETVETTILSIKSADVIEARMVGKIAEVTVKFVTELVSLTRDKDGNVTSGDPRSPQEVTDIWTFARSTSSSDPNWTLIATRTPQ